MLCPLSSRFLPGNNCPTGYYPGKIDQMEDERTYTAFAGEEMIASGPLKATI
jgi:hypothetical protein